jgi:protein-disulfide isomerase
MTTKTKKSTPIVQDEVIQDPEEFVTFKRSHFYSLLVVLAFAVGILVGYVAWGRNTATAAVAQPVQGPVVEVPVTEQPQYVRYDIPTDGYPSLGPEDAKIVIVEFSDFQCPFCRRFYQETYQALLEAYPGQIRFVYRNLPLEQIHSEAMPAAVAARCANEQNAFWQYHDLLFSSETLGQDVYIQYATDLGLDVQAFQECLTSDRNDAFIQEDMDFAVNMGVRSTPTFFINGLAIVGAQPLANFSQIIDKELAGEIPQ